MAFVYILYSKRIDKFYIGFTTLTPTKRLAQHNSGYYEKSFSTGGIPWELILAIPCQNKDHARRLEAYLKKMKSRTNLVQLIKCPSILEALVQELQCSKKGR